MNNNGYIRLHRKILNSPVFKDSELFQLFNYILLKSTHKDYKSIVGLTAVKLKSGQMIFGRNVASTDLNMSPAKIRKRIKVLEELDIITTKTTNKFTLVTVSNWGLYQNDGDKKTSKKASGETNKEPTNDHIQKQKKQEKHNRDENSLKKANKEAEEFLRSFYARKDFSTDNIITEKAVKEFNEKTSHEKLEPHNKLVSRFIKIWLKIESSEN